MSAVGVCSECRGTGRCSDCDGLPEDYLEEMGEECPTCYGSGDCYFCSGSGIED